MVNAGSMAAPAVADRGGRWSYLLVASLSRCALGFQFQALPALTASIAASLGVGLTEIGVLTGLYMLPGIVGALLAGLLLQLVSVRAALTLAMAAITASGLLGATADGFAPLAAARLVGGAGAVLATVAALKGTYDRFEPRQLPFANGISSAMQPFGIGCALIAFGTLGAAADWRFAFLLTAALGAAVLVLAAVVVREPPRPAADPRAAPRSKPTRDEWVGLVLAGCVMFPYVGCFYAFLSFLPAHLAATGWAPSGAALVLGLLGWAPILITPLGGWLAGATGRPLLVIALSMTTWGIVTVAAGLGTPDVPHIALMLLVGSAPLGIIVSMPARVVAPERRGAASGIFMAFLFAGSTVVPPLAAWVGDTAAAAGFDPVAAAVSFTGAAFLIALVPLALFARFVARRGA